MNSTFSIEFHDGFQNMIRRIDVPNGAPIPRKGCLIGIGDGEESGYVVNDIMYNYSNVNCINVHVFIKKG